MNATEKKIREIAVFLINVQTVNGIAETMNRIATLIDSYSEPVSDYFKGLYEYIDSDDKTFKPLTDDQIRKVQRLGARLILNSEDIITALIRLHRMIDWEDGENAMVTLVDRLETIAESKGTPSVKYDD